ncbi:chaplin [Streptomyces sp. NPDC059072]|uniref:chaplin n=1 Tax=Streptomyces sp. NPDC059072 TaxID=3346715 RepID=UPI0036CAAE6E
MVRARRRVVVALVVGAVAIGSPSVAFADAGAQGAAGHSPGVGSGNVIQVPMHIPVNVCGNTVNVIGLLNPSFGNTCINT